MSTSVSARIIGQFPEVAGDRPAAGERVAVFDASGDLLLGIGEIDAAGCVRPGRVLTATREVFRA